jgi:hypothetical protein
MAASTKITDDAKTALLKKLKEILEEIIDVDKRIANVDRKLQWLYEAYAINKDDENEDDKNEDDENEDGENEDDEDDRRDLIKQLQDLRTSLCASRKVFTGLASDIRNKLTEQRISDTNDNGKLLVGAINTKFGDGKITQYIHGVEATKGGEGIVGIAEGVDINKFFKKKN